MTSVEVDSTRETEEPELIELERTGDITYRLDEAVRVGPAHKPPERAC